jgi:hypothetical protein
LSKLSGDPPSSWLLLRSTASRFGLFLNEGNVPLASLPGKCSSRNVLDRTGIETTAVFMSITLRKCEREYICDGFDVGKYYLSMLGSPNIVVGKFDTVYERAFRDG